jgi:RNA polymerase sigma factor for flagellar operon FliA
VTPAKKKAAAKKPPSKRASSKKAAAKKTTAKPATKQRSSKKASVSKASKKKVPAKKGSAKTAAKPKAETRADAKKTAKKVSTKNKPTPKPTATKAATKQTSPAPESTASKATKKTSKSAKAPAANSASRKSKRSTESSVKATATPAVLQVAERPTEDLWLLYRKTRDKIKTRPTDAAKAELEELRNILMERHYPLVKYIAERLLQTLPKSIELDDLISAGLFGLMDAIRGFDPDRGIKFKTYCTTRIRGSILDQLRSQDWVPRLVRLKASRIDKALQRLTGSYGREPTHAELAQELELDHTELSKEMTGAHAKSMYSLSDKWEDRDDDSSMEKVDVLEDKKATDPIGELNRNDMMLFITRSLTHKERFIIEQYYQVGHTMREIGEMLALTESRVCQIHSNVMGRLKSLFGQKQTAMLL